MGFPSDLWLLKGDVWRLGQEWNFAAVRCTGRHTKTHVDVTGPQGQNWTVPRAKLVCYISSRPDWKESCHAGQEGECNWKGCPQLGERTSCCPYYTAPIEEG